MATKFTDADDALLEELGVEVEAKKGSGLSARDERVIAGFEEIQRYFDKTGHAPRHGEGNDIFERLYAARLDRLKALDDCRALLTPLDHQGLLSGDAASAPTKPEELDDDALLAELGVEPGTDITELKHVRPFVEKQAAEEIANRTPCPDFSKFKPLFQQIQNDLETGVRQTRPFEAKAEIRPGTWFIVGGQKAYVANMGEIFKTQHDKTDARLRVVFDNGTESNLLLRSLQRALHKDEAGRRITDPNAGPLFASEHAEGDLASGTIYVLRSKSDHPQIASHRELIHKIGVTGGEVETRIANAALDATYLLADVEIVATYKLYNINRTKLENLIHRVFANARFEMTIPDRFGNPVRPREWFLVPISVINEVVERIRDRSITEYVYDPTSAALRRRSAGSS